MRTCPCPGAAEDSQICAHSRSRERGQAAPKLLLPAQPWQCPEPLSTAPSCLLLTALGRGEASSLPEGAEPMPSSIWRQTWARRSPTGCGALAGREAAAGAAGALAGSRAAARASRHLDQQHKNKKPLWKEIEKGSSPLPQEPSGTTLEQGELVWVREGTRGKELPSTGSPWEVQGQVLAELLTWGTRHTPESAPCQRSATQTALQPWPLRRRRCQTA